MDEVNLRIILTSFRIEIDISNSNFTSQMQTTRNTMNDKFVEVFEKLEQQSTYIQRIIADNSKLKAQIEYFHSIFLNRDATSTATAPPISPLRPS